MKRLTQKLAVAAALIASMATANASLITSTGDAALTGATVETFDSVASGDYASLALAGVTVVGVGGPMTVDSVWTGAYGLGGQTLHNSSSSPLSFDLLFSTPVSAFGIWGGAVNNSWTYSAYDAADVLIESVTTSGACCAPTFHGVANTGIARVRLDGVGDWVIFDDLYFVAGGQVVPEPATLALLGLGLAGLAAIRRRKNSV
jgi:PEP-CTERM motif